MVFTSRATLILYCVCMFGGSVAGACHWDSWNCAESAEPSPITATLGLSCAGNEASGGVQACGPGVSPSRLKPSRQHHNEYGKFRPRHALIAFDMTAQDDDDDDDDDDSDLLVPPFVRRHRSVDPRHQAIEAMLAGSQSDVLAGTQASSLPWHELRPETSSLESLQVRLQI